LAKVRLPAARAERSVGNDAVDSWRISPRPFTIRQRQRGRFPTETPATLRNRRRVASTGPRDGVLHSRRFCLERETIIPSSSFWSSSRGSLPFYGTPSFDQISVTELVKAVLASVVGRLLVFGVDRHWTDGWSSSLQ